MSLRVAVALPPDLASRIVRDLTSHGHDAVFHAASGADLADALPRLTIDAAITSARDGYLSERLLAACDSAGVRLVSLVESPAERAMAGDLGIIDTVDANEGWAELHAALTATPWSKRPTEGEGGQLEEPPAERVAVADVATASPANRPQAAAPVAPVAVPPAATRGTVIAVWGPAGAPGRTTIAINVAAELAAEGYSVVLADADTHGGAVAPALGLLDEAPGFAAACRLAGTGGLNHAELERVGQRYRSGHGSFWVLTGISRPSRWPELTAERVEGTIEQCRSFADYTIIDTGFSLENDEEISSDLVAPRRNAATVTALRASDRILAVGSADPVCLPRFLRSHVDLLDTVDPERVHVIINRVRASVIGPSPARQVVHTLERFGGITGPVIVPHDAAGLDAALLAGKTLRDAAPKSPARAAVSALVTQRILPAPEPRLSRGRRFALGRLGRVQASS